MLKAVSSVANAVGALNYKGTWNATTNSPALASGSGTKGDYYVVSVAGTTTLDGISNWGVGDWAVFNGSVWQRVEGGADLNGVNLSVTGTTTLSGLTASTALALDASNNVVSVTNTGTGNNVLATSPSIATPTLTGDVQMSTGNLVVGTAGKGIDFSVTSSGTGTMTSELLSDYEEGTFVPEIIGTVTAGVGTYQYQLGRYTKIGNRVYFNLYIQWNAHTGSGFMKVGGLPFTSQNTNPNYHGITIGQIGSIAQTANTWATASMYHNATRIDLWEVPVGGGVNGQTAIDTAGNLTISGFYQTA